MASALDAAQFTWGPPVDADRKHLGAFACADPDKRTFFNGRKSHPHPWELVTQTTIRTKIKPRVAPPKFAVLGRANDGAIAAASIFEVDRSGFRELGLGWIFAIGVDKDLRRRGLGHHLMDLVIDRMLERVAEMNGPGTGPQIAELRVGGKVHKQNGRCQEFLVHAGWELTKLGGPGDLYDEWSTLLPVVTD